MQRILADVVTLTPNAEVLLLLYRFEHRRTFMSSGGDLFAEPVASREEESAHLHRMSTYSLTRHAQVALAEAALVRHFQPRYNVLMTRSNFAAREKIKVLDQLLKKDLTGLIVEICSSNACSRLWTASVTAQNLTDLFEPHVLDGSALDSEDDRRAWQAELHTMAHTHYAQFPLTTPEERDTFMHGTLWKGSDQRTKFL